MVKGRISLDIYNNRNSNNSKIYNGSSNSNNNIQDCFNKDDGSIYSWDNLRDDGIKVLARLDRFDSFSSSV